MHIVCVIHVWTHAWSILWSTHLNGALVLHSTNCSVPSIVIDHVCDVRRKHQCFCERAIEMCADLTELKQTSFGLRQINDMIAWPGNASWHYNLCGEWASAGVYCLPTEPKSVFWTSMESNVSHNILVLVIQTYLRLMRVLGDQQRRRQAHYLQTNTCGWLWTQRDSSWRRHWFVVGEQSYWNKCHEGYCILSCWRLDEGVG